MTRSHQFMYAQWALITALLMVLFHFVGNSTDVNYFGRSLFNWMITRWHEYGATYSHCWLIPIISAVVIYLRRDGLKKADKKIDYRGLILIIGALLLHVLGARCFLPRLSMMAFIILLWAIPFYLFGWAFARQLIFPVSYLFFCMPLSFLDSIASQLRLVMSSMSTGVLNGFGIESYRNGTIIYSDVAGGFHLNIADSCSGLRSFLALLSLTTAYAFIRLDQRWKQWVLFCLAIPIAVLGNMIRIVAIGFVALIFGQDVAEGVFHDWSGYIVFVAAVALVLGCDRFLSIDFKQRIQQWKKMSSKPATS